MLSRVNRRRFLAGAAAAAPALAVSFEERALARTTAAEPSRAAGAAAAGASAQAKMPTGRIKDLAISRLVCGGNLVSGFAHSRDLIYVSPLLKHYFTDEKVCATLELCEQNGINTAIMRLDSHILRILDRYWNQHGGRMQWIAQVKPTARDLEGEARRAIDSGAVAAYVQGGVADAFVREGRVDLLAQALEYIRSRKVPGGIGAHALETVKAAVAAGLEPDFFMKTLNAKNYWSAGPMPRHDSVWAETPEETIAYMRNLATPWIAFKVLGAGAIHPRDGFRYVFENGADFACVGMFDFQVAEDVIIARDVLAATAERPRPWCA